MHSFLYFVFYIDRYIAKIVILQNVVLLDDCESVKLLVAVFGFNFCVILYKYIYIQIKFDLRYVYRTMFEMDPLRQIHFQITIKIV